MSSRIKRVARNYFKILFTSTMSSNQQVVYMTAKIREGYEAADVTMWQQLLQSAKTEAGDSIRHLFLILDMAQHNKCDVLDIVKTGRVCSNSKAIDQKFADALMHCVDSPVDPGNSVWQHEFDHEYAERQKRKSGASVLDLTCDDESSGSSHSYEETSEPYKDNPTSAEAYEIDGFVVPDHDSEPEDEQDSLARFGGTASLKQRASKSAAEASTADAAPAATSKKRLLKRKVSFGEE